MLRGGTSALALVLHILLYFPAFTRFRFGRVSAFSHRLLLGLRESALSALLVLVCELRLDVLVDHVIRQRLAVPVELQFFYLLDRHALKGFQSTEFFDVFDA